MPVILNPFGILGSDQSSDGDLPGSNSAKSDPVPDLPGVVETTGAAGLAWQRILKKFLGVISGYDSYNNSSSAGSIPDSNDVVPPSSEGSDDSGTVDTFGGSSEYGDGVSNETGAAPNDSSGLGTDTNLGTEYTFGQFLEGLFASVGAENEANRTFNAFQAQANRDFQERLSNTAYQRAVRDLKAAGLNPALAFASNNSAASTPTGSAASYQTGGGDTLSSIISALANAASSLGDLVDQFFIKGIK